jgi:hypothetical protein
MVFRIARLRIKLQIPRMAMPANGSKIGRWQGAAPDLDQAKPAPKQPNLNKLGDAGGSKDGGKATMLEPIFKL